MVDTLARRQVGSNCRNTICRIPPFTKYSTSAGASILTIVSKAGPEHFASETDTPTFEIYPLTNEATATTGVRIGFAVESVDQVFEHLLSVGGQAVSAPKNSPWGRRAVIADPDGHRVELTSAIEPEEAAGG